MVFLTFVWLFVGFFPFFLSLFSPLFTGKRGRKLGDVGTCGMGNFHAWKRLPGEIPSPPLPRCGAGRARSLVTRVLEESVQGCRGGTGAIASYSVSLAEPLGPEAGADWWDW